MSYLAGGTDLLNQGGITEKFTAIGNGVKAVFTSTDFIEAGFGYYPAYNQVQVFVSGIYQDKASFIETNSNTITFITAPANGVSVEVLVTQAASSSVGSTVQEFYTVADGVKSTYSAIDFVQGGFVYQTGVSALEVFLDGVMQNSQNYTETSSTSITFNGVPAAGVNVLIKVVGSVRLADAIPLSEKAVAMGTASLDANSEVVQMPAGFGIAPSSQVLTGSGWNLPTPLSGSVLQVVGKTITTQGSQTLTADVDNQVGAGTDFIMNITPKGNNSKFIVEYRWFGEVDTAWDIVFNVHRDGVRLNNAGLIKAGLSMATQTYGAVVDNDSTPEIMHLRTLDQNGSTAGTAIAYKLVAASMSTALVMWTNRCFNASAGNAYEHGVSEIIITEIAA